MNSLKSVAVVAGLALLTWNVSAQQRGPMDAQTMTNNIKKNVTGITTDQESKILTVEQDFVKGAQDARSNSGGDREAMHSKMKTLKETKDAKIKTILNADQYAQYQKMEESHKGGMRKGGNQ